MKHFNKLTPAEAERVAILMEECGEVVHACGKILRHGYDNYSPFDKSKTPNSQQLTRELADLRYAIDLVNQDLDVGLQNVHYDINSKKNKYTHHQ